MSQISLKSISGITSITTPAGVDNRFSLYNYDSTERLVLDHSGNLNISGVSTATNFKTGSSNLHSTGLTVGDSFVHSTGVNLGTGVTISNNGNATFSGITTHQGNFNLPDSTNNQTGRLMLGTGTDLQIFHTGSAGEIGNFTGNLNIKTNSFRVFNGGANQLYIKADQNDSVILHHSNSEKIRTTNTGAVVTGILTATSFVGSGALLTGIVGGKFNGPAAGILTTSTVGIQTADVTSADLVGAATSMVGLYIGDGHLLFSNYLNKSGGYYITTGLNALNAGPVTLGSTMTLDGTWVIV
tara:strand:- start:1379 stop:2272 length:894 start_codon:yes stop_codon:yes gene_type:complete